MEASDISNKTVHQNHNKTAEKAEVKPVMEKVLVKVVEDMMVEKVSERVVKEGEKALKEIVGIAENQDIDQTNAEVQR